MYDMTVHWFKAHFAASLSSDIVRAADRMTLVLDRIAFVLDWMAFVLDLCAPLSLVMVAD